MKNKTWISGITVLGMVTLLVSGCAKTSQSMDGLDRADKIVKKLDTDDNGKISIDEWKKSKSIFKDKDLNNDGFITADELRNNAKQNVANLQDIIPFEQLDDITKGAFIAKFGKRDYQIQRGLIESTLTPIYPKEYYCPKIDHIFGEPWKGPIPNRFHMGTDIPAPWNEPIVAMADGTVIAKFKGEGKGFRGIQLLLRHTPEQTGLDGWLYTVYTHFNKIPTLNVGDKVKMGDILGPNGKTGVPGKRREPHLHLTINFSKSDKYVLVEELVIPENGYHVDLVSLFKKPFLMNSNDFRKLPENEKDVKISYKLESGEFYPKDSKIIWPFMCD